VEILDQDTQEVVVKIAMLMGNLKVEVVSPKGTPIPNANWRTKDGEDAKHKPNEAVELLAGAHTLIIKAPGFRPVEQETQIRAATDNMLKVVLKPAKAVIKGTRIEINDKVYFETAKAVIKADSHSLLDDVAAIIRAHPEIKRIRIEGHTDSQGNDAYNKKLSQDRAMAVKAYLISKGVNGEILNAVGLGEEKPVGNNRTAAGRTENRRVEFHLVDNKKKKAAEGAAQPKKPGKPLKKPAGKPPKKP